MSLALRRCCWGKKTSLKIFVLGDVFRNLSECITNDKSEADEHPYQEIVRLSSKRIFGYNSRMDNRKQVEGAIQTDEFVLKMSEAYTDSWVSGSDEKRQKALDAIYAWANADALTQTKPCAKNGRLLESCTEWTRNDGMTYQTKKTTQQHKSI